MDLCLSTSRSGSPTCSANGIWLHSRYDPWQEALRFARRELGDSKPSHVVLLGPCLDYLSAAVRSLLPSSRIAAVNYSAFFPEAGEADGLWSPSSPLSLASFLNSILDEDAISGVAVLEWEPATRAFPREAAMARAELATSLDALASSAATVKRSGRRWIANACASFLLVERAWEVESTRLPVLVAAAGPSLPGSLAAFSRLGKGFATIAVSSSLAACRSAGIEPDLVVATDGGYWSRLHLYPLASRSLPLASPLTALPSASIYLDSGLVLLNQSSFVESELLPLLGPAIGLPPHGTVSGTALSLAVRLCGGPIIVAGLDLASYGDREHARPHGFDPQVGRRASRISPLESLALSRWLGSDSLPLREPPWRTTRSLRAYASAFAQDSGALAGRLFRIGPSPVELPGFQTIAGEDLPSLLGGGEPGRDSLAMRAVRLPPRHEREGLLLAKLSSWREKASEACRRLGSGSLPTGGLAEFLRSIDLVDYAAARRALLSGGDPAPTARELASRCDDFLSSIERRFST